VAQAAAPESVRAVRLTLRSGNDAAGARLP